MGGTGSARGLHKVGGGGTGGVVVEIFWEGRGGY